MVATPTPAPALANAERRQVTVLFSDLTGFTSLTERLDPEETRQIMARIFGSAAEIVGRYEGRIEKSSAPRSWRSSASRSRKRLSRHAKHVRLSTAYGSTFLR